MKIYKFQFNIRFVMTFIMSLDNKISICRDVRELKFTSCFGRKWNIVNLEIIFDLLSSHGAASMSILLIWLCFICRVVVVVSLTRPFACLHFDHQSYPLPTQRLGHKAVNCYFFTHFALHFVSDVSHLHRCIFGCFGRITHYFGVIFV